MKEKENDEMENGIDRNIFRIYRDDYYLSLSKIEGNTIMIPIDHREMEFGKVKQPIIILVNSHNLLCDRMNASPDMYLTEELVMKNLVAMYSDNYGFYTIRLKIS